MFPPIVLPNFPPIPEPIDFPISRRILPAVELATLFAAFLTGAETGVSNDVTLVFVFDFFSKFF